MAVVANVGKPLGLRGPKITATQASITGTGNIATGLKTIFPGGAVVSPANSGTTTPWTLATQSSITGGTVAVVVLDVTSAPAIAVSVAARLINCLAVGTAA